MNLRKVSANALSILSSDVMNRATSFVLYALVARHLGAHEFGQLTLSFTLFYAFQVFAVGGLKTLLIRQVAKDRTQTARYFLNGCAIVMLTSIADCRRMGVRVLDALSALHDNGDPAALLRSSSLHLLR